MTSLNRFILPIETNITHDSVLVRSPPGAFCLSDFVNLLKLAGLSPSCKYAMRLNCFLLDRVFYFENLEKILLKQTVEVCYPGTGLHLFDSLLCTDIVVRIRNLVYSITVRVLFDFI